MRVGYSTSQQPMTCLPESVESIFWDFVESTIRLREVGIDKQLIEKVREENNTRSLTESSALYYCVFGRVSSKSLSRVPMSDKKNGKSDMIILTITCCLNLSSPPGLRTLDFSIPIGSDRTFISLSKFLRWAMRGRVARTPENFDFFKVSSASSYTSTHCAQEKVRAVVQVQLWNRYNFEFCFARLFSSETLFFVSTMLAMLLVY